jgi:hypothetical protein
VINVTIERKHVYLLAVIMTVAALLIPVTAWASNQFTDVPDSNVFHDDISWLADAGVTKGCNPPANDEFCPSNAVTREQMAAFMHRLADNQVVDAGKLDGMISDDFQPSVVPLGETVRGTIGVLDHVDGAKEIMANSSLPIPAPVGLTDSKVTVSGGFDDTDGACTGSAANPTADPGYVCIYPFSESNVGGNQVGAIWGDGDGTKWGFQVSLVTSGVGKAYFVANWAYTAPLVATSSAELGAENTPGIGGN